MSDKLETLHGSPPAAPAQPPVVGKRQLEDMTTSERLKLLQKKLREKFGDDFDPIVRMVELSEQAQDAGDLKTALSALKDVADRYYPKLRVHEQDKNSDAVPQVILQVSGDPTNEPSANGKLTAVPGSGGKRFQFE